MTQIPADVRAAPVKTGPGSKLNGMIRNFAPSWFASVMGTGVLAVGCVGFGRRFPVLLDIGVVIHWFNVGLFITLVIPWTLRWFLHRPAALADLRNPVMTQFYPTIGVGLLVLSLQFLVYGGHWDIAAPLWAAGVVVTLLFSIIAPFIVFQNEDVALNQVNPGMFIPPVALVVIPLAGGALLRHAEGLTADWMLFVNYASLGAGFFLYLAILALTFQRFVLGKLLPGQMIPTIWINLGPIGVTAASLISLVDASPFVADKAPFYVLALLLWGFGVWWLVMALVLTLGRLRRNDLPFSLTWWAFTFPLGAWASAGARLGEILHLQSVWYMGFAAFLLLVFIWSVTLVKTAKGVVSGVLFIPPPPPKVALWRFRLTEK